MTTRDPVRAKETTLPTSLGKAVGAVRSRVARLGELVFRTWPERRRQRAQLLEMDRHMLRDIGIHRADADHEGRKPFWRR